MHCHFVCFSDFLLFTLYFIKLYFINHSIQHTYFIYIYHWVWTIVIYEVQVFVFVWLAISLLCFFFLLLLFNRKSALHKVMEALFLLFSVCPVFIIGSMLVEFIKANLVWVNICMCLCAFYILQRSKGGCYMIFGRGCDA